MKMIEEVNIVPVRFCGSNKVYLYQLPMNETLDKNDYVYISGDKFAVTVAHSISVYKEGALYKWLLSAFGATEPLVYLKGRVKKYDVDDDVIPFE